MKTIIPKLGASGLSLLFLVCAILVPGVGCKEGPDRVTVTPEWRAFIELARDSNCADVRNQLFVIDHALVFWDRAGTCPDASYRETLFGRTPDKVLCVSHDSIAGPVKHCPDPSYGDLFDIVITHLDEPGLGLGQGHVVQQVPL